MTLNFFERHRDKIAFAGPEDCWLWTAGKSSGYGSVGARGKVRRANREAYESLHGDGSAAGLLVRHKCDVRACVNPAHLELGTHADNVRDMMERGGHRCAPRQGEAHGMSKLTEAAVRYVRKWYEPGSQILGQSALARQFGVSQSLISQVVHRQIWALVT